LANSGGKKILQKISLESKKTHRGNDISEEIATADNG
jgi:hypothetical protein